MGRPVYEIGIDLNDPSTGVTSNSLVLPPAHEIDFQTFGRQTKPIEYHFDDEQQIITGIAISADTKIYRRDKDLGEHDVVFTKMAVSHIIHQVARDGAFNNLNLDHNSKDVVDSAFMIMSYQIDTEKGFTAPERFKDANEGSWCVSYKIEDKDIYTRAKNGEFKGFSVEGFFIQKRIEMSKVKAPEKKFSSIIREIHKWDLNVSADSIEMGTELIWIDASDGTEWGKIDSGEYELEDGRVIQVDSLGVVVLIGNSETKEVIDEVMAEMDELLAEK